MDGEKKIVKTYEVIGGKKVPVYRVPTGVSGLTPEAKADLEAKVTGKAAMEAHDKSAPVRLAKLLDDGDVDSQEVEEFIMTEMDASDEVVSLFDSADVN